MKEEEKVMEHVVLYRSKATLAGFISILFVTSLMTVGDAVQDGFNDLWIIILLVLALILIGVSTIFRYTFYRGFYERVNVLFGIFNVNKKTISYNSLICFEVRRPYEYKHAPLVIMHYSEKKMKSPWFARRSFLFNWKKPETLIPLLTYLKEHTDVKIKIDIGSSLRKQYKLLKPFDNFSK
jgi:hypothetical protein